MSRKYKFHNQQGLYFVSFATVFWIDIFTREIYFDILKSSIDYCRKEKGMEVYAYCFMPSHLHFIFRSKNGEPSSLIRDFKGFTSRKLIKSIEDNSQESRKEWFFGAFQFFSKVFKKWLVINTPCTIVIFKVIIFF